DISGTPNALKVWVYGDGSGHFLNGWILDAKGQTWQVPFGQIFHTGWSQMTGVIDTDQKWPWTHISGPKDNKVDYPIQFRGFVLDDYTSSYQGSGEIFIDDLTVATVSNPTTSGGPVAITPTVGSGSATPSATEEVVTATDVGRILYTSGSTLMTTDPAWSSPQEVGTAASNSCGSPASTVSGQDISLSYGYYCPIGGSITKCASPNGAYEILVDGRDTENILLAIYPAGNQDAGQPIYTGSLDQAEGLRWSPNSDSYLFVIGNTVARGDLSAHYQQIIPTAYNPIFSADGSLILYRKPIGPGVNDVFVSNADGSNQHNVTNVSAIDKSCAAWVR
ncbi:MAG: hypothetical protein KAG66_12960, partial [Methylococcales bacterium]|nr:hypothetical protein [Methylococcales bacterium]